MSLRFNSNASFDDERREAITVLDNLLADGWIIKDAVLKIWKGERKESELFLGADAASRVMIRAVLRVVEGMERRFPRDSHTVVEILCALIDRFKYMNDAAVIVPALNVIAQALDMAKCGPGAIVIGPNIANLRSCTGGEFHLLHSMDTSDVRHLGHLHGM